MAAQKLYTVDEILWRPSVASGKEDITINTVTDITTVKGGDPQFFFGDGDVYSQSSWVENVMQSVQVTIADMSRRVDTDDDAGEDNSMVVGDRGILAIKYPQRATGQGGQSSTASTCLQAICGGPDGVGAGAQDSGCFIANMTNTGQQSGPGSVALEFGLTSLDGVTSAIALTMTNLS